MTSRGFEDYIEGQFRDDGHPGDQMVTAGRPAAPKDTEHIVIVKQVVEKVVYRDAPASASPAGREFYDPNQNMFTTRAQFEANQEATARGMIVVAAVVLIVTLFILLPWLI